MYFSVSWSCSTCSAVKPALGGTPCSDSRTICCCCCCVSPWTPVTANRPKKTTSSTASDTRKPDAFIMETWNERNGITKKTGKSTIRLRLYTIWKLLIHWQLSSCHWSLSLCCRNIRATFKNHRGHHHHRNPRWSLLGKPNSSNWLIQAPRRV